MDNRAEGSDRRLRITLALAITLAVILQTGAATVALAPAGGAHDRAVSPRAAVLLAGPRPDASSNPTVVRTLDLFNNTVFAGNSSATADWYPDSVAYDPLNATAWVGGGEVNLMGTEIVDPASGLGVRVLPGGVQSALAYDNVTNSMWVTGGTSGFANFVTVYNASTYAVEATIGTGNSPISLAFDWKTNAMYVVNFGSDNVSVIGGTNLTAFASVPVGEYATAIVFDPNNDKLYVTNREAGNITAFNQTPPRSPISITTDPPQLGNPYWLLYDSSNSELYVNDLAGGLGLINTTLTPETDVGAIALPAGCSAYPEDGMALTPDDSLYVACEQLGEVVEYSPAPTTTSATVTSVVPISPYAGTTGLAYDGALGRILAVDSNSGYDASTNLTEIATSDNSLVGSVPLENLPLGIATGGPLGVVYVYDGNTGNLDVLNEQTGAVERSVFVGYTGAHVIPYSGSVAYDSANGTVYVDFVQDYGKTSGVAAVNATTFAVTYLRSDYFTDPTGLLYDAHDHRVFVADFGSDQVGVVAPGSSGPPVNISVGGGPVGLALDTSDDSVYVTNLDTSNVSVIDAATLELTHNIPVGSEPVGITYDPENQDLYVADSNEYYLTIINGTHNATQGTISTTFTGHPEFVAYDPANETVLVTLPESSFGVGGTELELVNATNQTYFSTLIFGQSLNDVAWDADTETAFLSGTLPGTVYEYGVLPTSPPPPSITARLSAVPSTVQVEETTSLQTVVMGATSTLNYQYSTLPGGCTSSDVATLSCTPTETGTFYVGVNVTQTGGGSAAAVAELNVTPRAGPLTVSLATDPSTIVLGTSTNVSASASGGTLPLTYAYSTLPSGCTSANVSSFECTPTVAGAFVIGVNVTDSVGTVASATTTLNVTARAGPLTVSLATDPSTIVLGASTNVSASASGGTLPLTYAYSTLPSGCTSANVSNFKCKPTVAGAFVIGVNVTDSVGTVASATATLNVTVEFNATLTATPPSIELGSSSTLGVTVSGTYSGSLTYRYTELPSGCESANGPQLVCTPTTTGSFSPHVEVNDSVGDFANASTSLNVTTPTGQLSVGLSADPSTISLGASTEIMASASGGTLPLTYDYSTLPSGCTSANVSSFECTPTVAGAFVIGVNVTDSVGTVASATTTLDVTVEFTVTLTATPVSVELGNSSTLEVSVSGSHMGGLTYLYSELPRGCVSVNSAQLVCTPTATGAFTPHVEVNDSDGHFANATASLSVTQGSSSPAPAGTSSGLSSWLWILLVVAAVILVIAVVVVRRRKKEPEMAEGTERISPPASRSPEDPGLTPPP